ncbi:MAG TPA: crossover junction endodeoxyribonuclease RuvC [Actinomycetota bacterium]|nr:crossover junction endodeoxyribonuclease RuvC [Actinomycetota bacterium]
MFERVVVGVDPGTAATGLAAVRGGDRGPEVLEALTVRTPSTAPETERLRTLRDSLAALLHRTSPQAMAVERLMWGRNVRSAMSVARASGVVLLTAADAAIPVHEYAPLEVKLAVAGNGVAPKGDIRRALERIHGIAKLPREPDAVDAVAVAVCHLQQNEALAGLKR